MRRGFPQKQRGLSLIELMISMVLGLIVLAGVVSIFSANRAVSRTSDNLSRLQESARTAFLLMSRDIREAGINDCGRIQRVVNVLQGGNAIWWANWNGGLTGYESGVTMPGVVTGGGTAERVAGTDSLDLMRGVGNGLSVVSHDPVATQFKVNQPHGFVDGEVVIACDFMQASIFQISNSTVSTTTLVHGLGSVVPGNCSKGLGWKSPPDCSNTGTTYTYGPNSSLMKLESAAWYVGNNGRAAEGGRSLYRASLGVSGGTASATSQEIVDGVQDLQLTYRLDNADDYVAASAIAANAWPRVVAVRIELVLQGVQKELDSGGKPTRVERRFSHVVALRNRVA